MIARLSRVSVAVAALAVCLIAAPSGHAQPGMFVGVSDDFFKIEGALGELLRGRPRARSRPRDTSLARRSHDGRADSDAADLDRAVATGRRVVVSVYGDWQDAPQDAIRARRVLRLRSRRARTRAADPGRRHLERAEPVHLLAPAVRRGRQARVAGRVRGAARALLGRPPRRSPRRERDRAARSVRGEATRRPAR